MSFEPFVPGLPIADRARADAFCTTGLGLEAVTDPDGHVWMVTSASSCG